jgi:hypothetical protein
VLQLDFRDIAEGFMLWTFGDGCEVLSRWIVRGRLSFVFRLRETKVEPCSWWGIVRVIFELGARWASNVGCQSPKASTQNTGMENARTEGT